MAPTSWWLWELKHLASDITQRQDPGRPTMAAPPLRALTSIRNDVIRVVNPGLPPLVVNAMKTKIQECWTQRQSPGRCQNVCWVNE